MVTVGGPAAQDAQQDLEGQDAHQGGEPEHGEDLELAVPVGASPARAPATRMANQAVLFARSVAECMASATSTHEPVMSPKQSSVNARARLQKPSMTRTRPRHGHADRWRGAA